ncbi:MAG: insulinase family protein, partial [Sciscionella sp.]
YRMPDPVAELSGYLGYAVLAAVLTEGDASRLQQRMVHTEALVTDISARAGLMGAPLDSRDPDTFNLTAIHAPAVDADKLLAVLDAEFDRLATDGPTADELAMVSARYRAELHTEHDRLMSRTLVYGATELLHGRAELVAELPELIAAVDAEQIRAAAAALAPHTRAVLTVTPSGTAADEEGQHA